MKTIDVIMKELGAILEDLNEKQYQNLVQKFKEDRRFFFVGEGRSGLIAKAIAMRLMHSGKQVYVVGETTTPAIEGKDLLIAVSASFKTGNIVQIVNTSLETGAEEFVVTTNMKALETYNGLFINAATKYRKENEPNTIQPLGNQFDQSAHLILDAAIIDSLKRNHDFSELKKIHSNLE